MHPILFRWGSFTLYWYSVLVYLGIVLGVVYGQWQGRRTGYHDLQVLDGTLWGLAGGLIGARMAYVLPNWADYAGRPLALLSLWGGGLTFQGGLLGGALALGIYSLYAGLSFPRLMDLAAPAVCLAQCLGWGGALLHGANYGLVMRSPLSLWLPDLYGVYGPRLPTQLLACVLGFLLFLLLHKLSGRGVGPGMLGLLYLLLNGIGHFLLEFIRADEAARFGLLRMTQIAELAEAAVASILLPYLWLRWRRYRRDSKW